MKNILKETSRLIDFKGRIFVINTLLLSIIFILLNFFNALKYNILNIENYLNNNQQIRVLFKEDVSEETIKQFENELIKDPKVTYHAFGAKELTVKSLEEKIKLNIAENNSIRNHMSIFLGNMNNINDVQSYVDSLNKREFTERVLFNKELFTKIINTKNVFHYFQTRLVYIFIIPLYLLMYLLFRLNFINYEDELFIKYSQKQKGTMILAPYYLKKIINILVGWCISYIVFSVFYTKIESLLFVLNPNMNFVIFENIPRLSLILPIIISIILVLLAGLFVKKNGGAK